MSSGVRTITVSGRLRDALAAMRARRAIMAESVHVLDEQIADLEMLRAPIEALEAEGAAAGEGADRAHLLAHGALGAIVLRIADAERVSLRHVLGPGTCRLARPQRAREAAICEMLAASVSFAQVARVFRVSPEAVRAIAKRAARRAG